VTGYALVYNRDAGPYVVDVWTVPDNFINTGLAYDPDDHVLYCSHLELGGDGEYVETLCRSDGTRVAPAIPVDGFTRLVQGLAFVRADASFWIWGGPDSHADKRASHFTGAGVVLDDSFDLPGYPGSLEHDATTGLVWSRANLSSTVELWNPTTGQRVDAFDVGFGEEGLARDPYDRTVWGLTRTQVHHVERDGGWSIPLGTYPNPSHHYPPDVAMGFVVDGAAEGVVVDPSDRTLWFNADQHMHGGIPGGNRCWHVDPLGTHDTAVLLPGGPGWPSGRHLGTRIVAGRLELEDGTAAGSYLSAVLDLGPHRAIADSLDAGGAVEITYRGSDTSPTTPARDHLTRPYHPAGAPGDGWGDTVPSAWSHTPPASRFVQVALHLAATPAAVGFVQVALHLAATPAAVAGPRPVAASPALAIHPTPASGPITLTVGASPRSPARLAIHDVNGRRRIGWTLPPTTAGVRRVLWAGTDRHGRRLPAGVYLCTLEIGGAATRSKLVRLP
jgi:hypothetical protein